MAGKADMTAAEFNAMFPGGHYSRGASLTRQDIWQREQRDHQGDRLNKTERDYQRMVLEPRRLAGEIREYRAQCISLRLAGRTHLRPDFQVWCANGRIELHDAKGRWDPATKAKWKIAVEMYPMYLFVVAQKRQGAWHIEVWG
jgi:hypothetical protein